MRASVCAVVVVAAALALLPTTALSHHSFAAEFDGTQPVNLRGTITKVEWVNPHGWIYIDVRSDSGQVVSWAVETAGPNALARRGVKRTDLPIGIEIVVQGYRAKNGTPTANASTLTLPDGRALITVSSGTGSPAETEKVAK